jgi:hypothetical protein
MEVEYFLLFVFYALLNHASGKYLPTISDVYMAPRLGAEQSSAERPGTKFYNIERPGAELFQHQTPVGRICPTAKRPL